MIEERVIDVRPQKNLSARQVFHLCVKGIKHRLLRSVLTLAVVVLAVAFFMFLLSENAYVKAVAESLRGDIVRQRFTSQTLSYLYNAPTTVLMSRRLADAAADEPARLAEYARVAKWDLVALQRLAAGCREEQIYLAFFDAMPIGKRVLLVHKLRDREIFTMLRATEGFDGFSSRIKPMVDIRVPGGLEHFRTFLAGYGEFDRKLADFTRDWKTALDHLTEVTAPPVGNIETWLRSASPDQLGVWAAQVSRAGFSLPDTAPRLMQDQLKTAALRQEILLALSTPEKRALWRTTYKERKLTAVDEKLFALNDDRVVTILDHRYPREVLAAVSAEAAYDRKLSNLETTLSGKAEKGQKGRTLSGRQAFLLFISFLVCMVGIANAMLMSITERFREIATMKCLGATDRYILIQFMMEAGLQGIAGSTLGMLLGFLISSVKSTIAFGPFLFLHWPGLEILAVGLISVAAGVLLAVIASVYPSWAASRMAPMDAMRIE